MLSIFLWIVTHWWAMWGVTALLVAGAGLVAWALPKQRLPAILFAVAVIGFSTYNTLIVSTAKNQVRQEVKTNEDGNVKKAQTARKVQRDRCVLTPSGCVRERWFRD